MGTPLSDNSSVFVSPAPVEIKTGWSTAKKVTILTGTGLAAGGLGFGTGWWVKGRKAKSAIEAANAALQVANETNQKLHSELDALKQRIQVLEVNQRLVAVPAPTKS